MITADGYKAEDIIGAAYPWTSCSDDYFSFFSWFSSTNPVIARTCFIFDILKYPAFLLKCIKYAFALLTYFKLRLTVRIEYPDILMKIKRG